MWAVLRFAIITCVAALAIIAIGEALGFGHVASGPMVRSSYHADEMAHAAGYVAEAAAV